MAPDPVRSDTRRLVEAFYEARPFPGYASDDDGPALLDRARRSAFLRALDDSIAPDARVLDCGAGTCQLAAYLALAAPARCVVAVDACAASLREAERFRARARLPNLHLVRADVFDLPLRPQGFPVVISRGVVHHTAEPLAAIAAVARNVAPGGHLVLGFYETAARAAHRARRGLARLLGTPLRALDPVLRRPDLDEGKKLTWIEDQYRHPVERSLPLPEVLGALEGQGFEWVRSVPPAPGATGLLEAEARPGPPALAARRTGWLARGLADPDAGLVCLVVRRQARS